MTRAIRISRTGGPEVPELEEISLPEPQAGEALVRHLTRPTLFSCIASREALRASASSLFQAIRDGLKVEIGQRFPLAEAGAAHRALASRRTTGSTLLTL